MVANGLEDNYGNLIDLATVWRPCCLLFYQYRTRYLYKVRRLCTILGVIHLLRT